MKTRAIILTRTENLKIIKLKENETSFKFGDMTYFLFTRFKSNGDLQEINESQKNDEKLNKLYQMLSSEKWDSESRRWFPPFTKYTIKNYIFFEGNPFPIRYEQTTLDSELSNKLMSMLVENHTRSEWLGKNIHNPMGLLIITAIAMMLAGILIGILVSPHVLHYTINTTSSPLK